MTLSGNTQAFVLATIAFVGFFVYGAALAFTGRTPDPVFFPAALSITTLAGSFFFSAHIANGAAGKALDALVQTGKDREAAVATATSIANGSTGDSPATPKPGA